MTAHHLRHNPYRTWLALEGVVIKRDLLDRDPEPVLPKNANILAICILVQTFQNIEHFRSETLNLVILNFFSYFVTRIKSFISQK